MEKIAIVFILTDDSATYEQIGYHMFGGEDLTKYGWRAETPSGEHIAQHSCKYNTSDDAWEDAEQFLTEQGYKVEDEDYKG